MDLEFKSFVRKPFVVSAIEVTPENIEELAKLIGVLRYVETTGAPYIQVDRKKVPNVFQVKLGFWVTKMDDKIRAYSKKVFSEQFEQGILTDSDVKIETSSA